MGTKAKFGSVSGNVSATRRNVATRQGRTLDLPEPPDWPGAAWRKCLDEPLHKDMKRRRVKAAKNKEGQRTQETKGIPVEEASTLRPLIGFITSGEFSYRHGCGVGIGAVAALPYI